MNSMSSIISASVLSMRCTRPSTTSPRLCGGMLVAIPTAMPEVPFTSRLGKRDGITVGSLRLPSKLSTNSTVSLSMSASISSATRLMRHSVYLMAAALSPSTLPKLPCPSINMYLREKGCAMRTNEP